jgi:uncharacterized protein YbjT (DUF2867 family)
MAKKDVVVGGIGFTGKYIVRRLLAERRRVTVLTGHPNRRNEFGRKISILPFNFDNYESLVKSLKGTRCLFNTYWVRFNYRNASFEEATKNSKLIIDACVDAKVERLVHISVINPSQNYHYEYFRKKKEVEDYIRKSGLSYAILRPALLFGDEEILMNNMAWLMRRYGVFFIFGSGKYKVTPVFVDDVAKEAVRQSKSKRNVIEDAVGPETYEFEKLIRMIADTIDTPVKIYHLNRILIPAASSFLSFSTKDIVVTPEEMRVVSDDTLHSTSKPTGSTRFSEWLRSHRNTFGREYHSEIERHFSNK